MVSLISHIVCVSVLCRGNSIATVAHSPNTVHGAAYSECHFSLAVFGAPWISPLKSDVLFITPNRILANFLCYLWSYLDYKLSYD